MVDGRLKTLLVHRKGATRAFPPHHPLIPVDYQLIGQPVLIGGTMGTCSYVLTGVWRVKWCVKWSVMWLLLVVVMLGVVFFICLYFWTYVGNPLSSAFSFLNFDIFLLIYGCTFGHPAKQKVLRKVCQKPLAARVTARVERWAAISRERN